MAASSCILPVSTPAANPPPCAGRAAPPSQIILFQLLVGAAVPAAFQLFDKLHLYPLFAALVTFLLFGGILLVCILSYSAEDRTPCWLWINWSACCALFGAFVLGFYCQMPLDFFLRSCLAFLSLAAAFVGPLFVLQFGRRDLLRLCFDRLVNGILRFWASRRGSSGPCSSSSSAAGISSNSVSAA